MVKSKNKRNRGLADRVYKRKSEIHKKKLNPFEVHINREKLKVLGKKSKHDRGLPGVSRAKAIQKRKDTLGVEMKLMNKTNSFVDRRIGEKDRMMSAEERVTARFAAERASLHSKKNIYNLADDEILTHRGQTLEQIEKFDDPRSSDEEDEDGRKFAGGLGDEFVAEGHFGGGVLSKSSQDGAKSHKDLIEQLIAESKKRKAEKQKEKELTLDLTEQLDTQWKDLQPVVFKKPRLEEITLEPSVEQVLSKVEKKGEDYDKAMRELRFEKRGTPSDGLKNPVELAREEREKIELYEKERDIRMCDPEIVQQKQPTITHRSADDLDDNFELDEGSNYMLSYDKDGKPLMPEEVLRQNSGFPSSKKVVDGISDTSDDDDDDNDEEDEDEEDCNSDDEEDDTINNKKKQNENNKDEHNNDSTKYEEINSKMEEDFDETAQKHNGDNKSNKNESDSDESGSGEEESSSEEEIVGKGNMNNKFKNLDDLKESDDENNDTIEVQDKITSFFDFKNMEGDNLKELLTDKTPAQQSAILQKLIKNYDPSLSEDNKEKLKRLYAHLLQYLNDIFTNLQTESEIKNAFGIFDRIAPYFYDLSKKSAVITKKYLMEVITEKYQQFKNKSKLVPDLDTLIFFKLASLLYPTSDYRHPVVTPCFVFITEILRQSNFDSPYSISRGILLITLLLEYTLLSKKYVPSLVNFLRGIFYFSANISVLSPITLVPPFRLWKNDKYLNLEQDCSKMAVGDKMTAKDLILENVDEEFKIRSLDTCVRIFREYFEYFNDLEAQETIFKPHLDILDRVDLDNYPKKVKIRVRSSVKYMRELLESKTFTPLSTEVKKTKVLRLYEPDIQEVFTGKVSKLSREQIETNKLKHKYKREMKGAIREIRRDKAYIASVKLRQKMHSDNIRKEKVKQIYKDASIQQGELNKMKRMK